MKNKTKHVFTSYDGTLLEGTLCIPSSSSKQLALLVHGIMSSRDELGLYSGLAEYLLGHGISSFRFDYRCHGTNKQEIKKMTLAGIVNDIEAACNYACSEFSPNEIYPIGMSFGGGLTAFWSSVTKNKINAVIMLAPVIDYQEDILGQHGLIKNNKLSTKASKTLLRNGFIETDEIEYGEVLINEIPYINGINGLKSLQYNSLILHGDNDSIVPYSQSEKFVELSDKCKLINVIGTDHGFGIPGDEDLTWPETKNRHSEVYQIITNFIVKNG